MLSRRGRAVLALIAGMVAPGTAAAAAETPSANAGAGPPTIVSEVDVAPTSPLGVGVAPEALATPVQVLAAADLAADGEPDLLRSLGDRVPGVALDFAAGNPEQPTLLYHGFQAGPLQGTAEGLAVYIDGVRFNAPFGDTINFDLIPSIAIDRLALEGANPAFGLNALGGSVSIQMKTGATFDGAEAAASGGSFGRREVQAQAGGQFAGWALYGAVEALAEQGWRDDQSSLVERFAANAMRQWGAGTWRIDVRAARTVLNGPGVSPVQLLTADPSAQFTGPNAIANHYAAFDVGGRLELGHDARLNVLAYVQTLRQQVSNGNVSDDLPCTDGSGLLCSDSGYTTGIGGGTIPAFLGPSPFAYSELAEQVTDSVSYGASAQVDATLRHLGPTQKVSLGASFDGAASGFRATTLVGGMSATRGFVGPGLTIDEPGLDQPVDVGVIDSNLGLYAADAIDLAPRLTLTASARLNANQTRLSDRLGGDLSGAHRFSRVDPAVGLAWRARAWMAPFIGYSEANRTPTPAELSCASPVQSCSLANFFVADPNLEQVVARTLQAGLRGQAPVGDDVTLGWTLDVYRTTTADDIAFVNAAALGRAYFANIGATRRQGVDVDLTAQGRRWRLFFAWSHTEATYLAGFVEQGGSNPGANADGDIVVRPGDRLPGAPREQVKFGARWSVTPRIDIGVTGSAQSSQPFFGDEANLEPPLKGFVTLNGDCEVRVWRGLTTFVRVENLLNARYATYGTFSPTSQVYLAQAPGASDPRSLSPAAPRGVVAGARYRF